MRGTGGCCRSRVRGTIEEMRVGSAGHYEAATRGRNGDGGAVPYSPYRARGPAPLTHRPYLPERRRLTNSSPLPGPRRLWPGLGAGPVY